MWYAFSAMNRMARLGMPDSVKITGWQVAQSTGAVSAQQCPDL